MAERPEHSEYDSAAMPVMPTWAADMRLTKEQLEAAERTRAYHLRRLQRSIARSEHGDDGSASHSEH